MPHIDTPDFEQVLRDDRAGSFHRAVEAEIFEALATLRPQLQCGLSPLEFEQARKIEAALEKAAEVIRFSAHLSTANR